MTRRVGVEISSAAVRMAMVDEQKQKLHLVRYAEARLPVGAVVDGIVIDREAVGAAIAACMAEGGFRASRVTGILRARVSVAGLRAVVREIEMAAIPDAELDSAVRLQANDIVPFPEERTLFSARTVAPRPGAEPAVAPSGRNRVLIAAAHRDLVEAVVDVVSDAGIVVDGVDLASLALVRAFAARSEPTGGPEAVVAVGAELTIVVVHERGEAEFVRTIARGGNAVTRTIAAALDLPFSDAEDLKVRISTSMDMPAGVAPEALAAARDGATALLTDIRSTIDYYASLEGRSEVERIVLTGGGSLLGGFRERLQSQTRATVIGGDWLEHVAVGRSGVERERLRSTGAVAVGLALAEPAHRKALDLVPPETVRRWRQRRAERRLAAAAVVVVLGFVGGGAYRYVQVRNAETGVGSLNGQIAVLRQQIPRYDTVARQNAAISTDQTLGQPLVSHEVNWPAVLAALVRYTPSRVGATGFSGTVSVPLAATSATTSASATATAATATAAAAASSLPPTSSTIGTVNISLSAPGFPAFQQWFDAMLASGRFLIDQYSGLTNSGASPSGGPASGAGIAFTAQLGITGATHTDRLGEFEVSAP